MKATKFVCDYCSKEIENGSHRVSIKPRSELFISVGSVSVVIVRDYDFCSNSCASVWILKLLGTEKTLILP